MCVSIDELEARWARCARAAGARIVRARSARAALCRLGVIRADDRLVAADNDRPLTTGIGGILDGRAKSLARAREPDAEGFLEATASLGAEGSREGRRTLWLVSSIMEDGPRVPDIAALARAAGRAGALLVVDNSIATCAGCAPMLLGADVVCEELSLADVRAGGCAQDGTRLFAVACGRSARRGRRGKKGRRADDRARDPADIRLSHSAPDSCGNDADIADPVPFGAGELALIEAAVALTPERSRLRGDHARAIAAYLACHPAVSEVSYPGLESHRDHETAMRGLSHGFGPILRFESTVPIGDRLDAAFPSEARLGHPTGAPVDQRDRALAGATSVRVAQRAARGRSGCSVGIAAGTDDPLAVIDSLDRLIRRCAAAESSAAPHLIGTG